MTKRKKPVTELDPLGIPPPMLGDEDQASVDAAREWIAERKKTSVKPPVYWRPPGHRTDGKPHPIQHFHGDRLGHADQMRHALGSLSDGFATRIVNQLVNGPGVTGDNMVEALNDGLAFVAAHEPRNEVETMILVQFWTVHHAMMAQGGRMGRADTIPQLEAYANVMTKLGGLGIRQLEALAKMRGGGKQEVTVTHVHQHVYVADGGQAVVGHNVTGGGGGDSRNLVQSHAPALGHAISPEVRRENPEREALRRAGNQGEGTVSDARRPGRRAQGRAQRSMASRSPDQRYEGGQTPARRDE